MILVLRKENANDADSLLNSVSDAFLIDELELRVGGSEQFNNVQVIPNESLESSCRAEAQHALETSNRQRAERLSKGEADQLDGIAEQWEKDKGELRAKRLSEKRKRIEDWAVAILANGCQFAIKVVGKAIGAG